MSRAAKIEDVASRAGVSVATVSRALRGLPHVSQATREKVLRAAEELDYRPNPHAARLAAGRSGTVGVALPVLNSWFYANVLAGVEAVLAEEALDMHVVVVDGPDAVERFIAELPALSKRVDGLVLCDLFMPDQLWEDLAGGPMPVATIGVDTGLFDSVTIDNVVAASDATDHLLDLGHTRIGLIGAGPEAAADNESAALRRRGMIEALRRRALDLPPELEAAGSFSVAGGKEAMQELLGDTAPTAVFCLSDEMAIGAMWAADEAGLAVPGDLAVVGFDDQPVAEALGLTTVRQPVSIMAARAANFVLARLEGEEGPVERHVMPTQLQKRRSTDFRHLTHVHAHS
ncbi:MAG TPA: LacI family DNA-binding transcriptional regulator [Acidimicrobiia bacterium]|jgi:LacI family repressor for deo operon, udp, cdd, tsx, nupC, and nupG